MALTASELKIIDLTAELWNSFIELQDHHPADLKEMAQDIHNIQHRVMARLARREHPDVFRGGK